MRIDAHQHFWMPERLNYRWLTPALPTLFRDYLPEDLAPLLQGHGIDGTVLIQAAPNEEETEFLLALAERNSFVRAVVGWIDLSHTDPTLALEGFAARPVFRGIRPMLQDEQDIGWLLEARLDPLFNRLVEQRFTFDALVRPHQLPKISQLLHRHPELHLVIDHGAKPAIAARAWEPWASDIAAVARCPNAFVKLSGLLTEAAADDPSAAQPYADHLLNCFGPERVMWGSDWPVLLMVSDYDSWFDAAWSWCSGHQDKIFASNAKAFYRIGATL